MLFRSLSKCRVSLAMALAVCLGLTAIAALPGCGGCRRETAAEKKKREEEEKKKKEEEKKKKKEKPKPDFVGDSLKVQPYDDSNDRAAVKSGHWVSATQRLKANNFNFQGELHSATVSGTGKPIDLERTPYRIAMTRPASLPKEQEKHFETSHYVPRQPNRQDNNMSMLRIQSRLRQRGSSREVWSRDPLTEVMPAHQFFLVVLAGNADSYGYLKQLDSIAPPWDDFDTAQTGEALYYRVVLPKITKGVPLPSHALNWTAVAVVVWDDVSPETLTPDQQRAMLDWLHWGGQLIVSGPRSMERLKGSFLADYLPAKPGKGIKLTQDRFDAINDRFSPVERNKGKQVRHTLTVVPDKPLEGVELIKHGEADSVPFTGDLVVERRAGRGRIVVTAFSLTVRPVKHWPNFDGFFNACLLRRPARQFAKGPNLDLIVKWADAQTHPRRLDPRLVSQLRYFSRDMGHVPGTRSRQPVKKPRNDDEWMIETEVDRFGNPIEKRPAEEEFVDDTPAGPWAVDDPPLPHGGYHPWPQSGMGGWNDFSGASDAARDSLRQAAGIAVPDASFVVQVLGFYLIVLVPVNWGIFRIIGRVEWAWVAAPLIAIAGAVAVVKLAQLDIGFARSRTEIAVLEIQGGYDRGHLTRYTALYTSLSTGYEVFFEDDSAQVQPFCVDPAFKRLVGEGITTVTLRREKEIAMSGYQVRSNSTGMIHSEQMFRLGGPLKLITGKGRAARVVNDSDLTIEDAGVIWRRKIGDQSRVEVAWIGTLKPKMTLPVTFKPATGSRTLLAQWNDSPETALDSPSGQLSLRRLLDLAQDPRRIGVGDVRLIGWTGQELPGMAVRPSASQAVYRTLIVAHLRYGPLGDPQPDENTRREINVIDDDDRFSAISGQRSAVSFQRSAFSNPTAG